MKIGILVKLSRPDFNQGLRDSLDWLKNHGCQALVAEEVASTFNLTDVEVVEKERLPEECDVLLVFGGDGTLLSAARLVGITTRRFWESI